MEKIKIKSLEEYRKEEMNKFKKLRNSAISSFVIFVLLTFPYKAIKMETNETIAIWFFVFGIVLVPVVVFTVFFHIDYMQAKNYDIGFIKKYEDYYKTKKENLKLLKKYGVK